MTMPRIRIAWLMAFVALLAVNFLMIRMDLDHHGDYTQRWSVGILPMVNIMAVGLLVFQGRPEDRRGFLLGFEIFGAAVLGNYIALISTGAYFLQEFLILAYDPIWAFLGRAGWTTPRLLLAYSLLSAWAVLPLLAVALLGGLLTRNYGRDERLDLDRDWEDESNLPETHSPDIS